jgi:hypothetical protein
LTVSEIDTYNALTNIVSGVKTLRFDKDTGFQVTSLGNNSVKISLGSSFKTWNVTGQPSLVAQGEDTVRFVGNNGISITTSNTAGNKKITFNGHLANTNAYIATKLNTTTFNSALANTNAAISNKLNSSNPTIGGTLTVVGDTSLTKLVLSTALGTSYGGTGLSSVTVNGILFGANSSALSYLTGTSGQLLQIGSDGIPKFDKLDGGDYT